MEEVRAFHHDAGILLASLASAPNCGVARVLIHSGLCIRPANRESLFVSIDDAHVLWCGYYGKGVVANGWEPYDQPNPAAYMPLGYEDLDRTDLPGGGAFLVQRQPKRQSVTMNVADDGRSRRCEFLSSDFVGRAAERLGAFLLTVGVAPERVAECVDSIGLRLDASLGNVVPSAA